jgi:DNA invertase Pin-like site-specific DNA recombinase
MTKRAALYVRQSKNSDDGIDRQIPRVRALAELRGWEVADIYEDNDVTASKPRGPQTAWGRMLADAAAGRVHVVVGVDLDRVVRSTKDLNTLVDAGLALVTVDGEIDLASADGEFRASMLAAIARFEVRRKGERQRRAQEQRAEKGRAPAGVRLTGYDRHGVIVEDEARVVRKVFDRFLAGESLKGLSALLKAEGVQTRRGGEWHSSSVRTMLMNARYAGRSTLKGQVVGKAQWPAIVPEATFDAVQSRLNDPRRKTAHDTARKHLGSGVYFCECGRRVRASSSTGSGGTRYTCAATCFYRVGSHIDDYVVTILRRYLSRPDLADLLVRPDDSAELDRLNAQVAELENRLRVFESDYDDGLIDGTRYRTAVEKANARLDEARRARAKLARPDSSVLAAPDPVQAFDAASLDVQRATVDMLMRVTLLPGKRGRKGFDPDSVMVEWR